MSNEDLSAIGYVPTKRQYAHRKTTAQTNKYIKNAHCVDHTGFRENCPNCLMLVVFVLAERLSELETILHKEITEGSSRHSSRHPQRGK